MDECSNEYPRHESLERHLKAEHKMSDEDIKRRIRWIKESRGIATLSSDEVWEELASRIGYNPVGAQPVDSTVRDE